MLGLRYIFQNRRIGLGRCRNNFLAQDQAFDFIQQGNIAGPTVRRRHGRHERIEKVRFWMQRRRNRHRRRGRSGHGSGAQDNRYERFESEDQRNQNKKRRDDGHHPRFFF